MNYAAPSYHTCSEPGAAVYPATSAALQSPFDAAADDSVYISLQHTSQTTVIYREKLPENTEEK